MALFQYRGKDANGKRKTDFISAFNEDKARRILENKGYEVKDLKGSDSLEMKVLKVINPIKTKELVVLSRQLAVMVSANLPIVKCLEIAVEQTDNINLKMILSDVTFEVDAGSRLSEALAKRSHIFSQFYINVIRSGETSGKLDEVLTYLADEMEKDFNIVSKIKSAMIYPLFVLGGLIVVGAIMMIFVVPELTSILERSGAELPLSTRIVMGTSDVIARYWWLLLAVIIAVFVVLRMLIKKDYRAAKYFDHLKLRLPVMGKLFKHIYIVRFTRSMYTLVVSGITITKSLNIVSEVVGSPVYKEILEDTLKEVEEGNSLAAVFMTTNKVPPMVPQMISVGEKTGRLDTVLDKLTEFYEGEINKRVENLVSLLEPIIIVVLGVGVGLMIASILMPMYNMASQV